MSIFSKSPERIPVIVPAAQLAKPTQEYKRLAEELGVQYTDDFRSKQVEFMKFLQDEVAQVYSLGSVDRYMTKLAAKQNKQYVWLPARESDRNFIGNEYNSLPDTYPVSGNQVVAFRSRVRTNRYTLPIPYPVLLTMQTFQQHFGNDVAMFITDYETKPMVYPDPFLGIFHKPTRTFVIVERWDEPSYRMES